MELIIVLAVLIAALFWWGTNLVVPHNPKVPEPVRPEVIEDTSHLKADLARAMEDARKAKEELSRAFIELGQVRNQFGIISNENSINSNIKINRPKSRPDSWQKRSYLYTNLFRAILSPCAF
jgi:hypothetical protein